MLPLSLLLALMTGCPAHPAGGDGMDGGTEVVLLPFPPDGGAVTWTSWAGPFVTDYCVQCHNPNAACFASGCHSPGDPQTPDFRDKSSVVGLSHAIQCGISAQQDPSWNCGSTAPKTFPVFQGHNPLPTDTQRALVVDWIDAGCP